MKIIFKIDQSRYETPNADYITLPSARTDIRDIFAVVKHSQVRVEQIEGRDWIIHPRALSFAHKVSHMFSSLFFQFIFFYFHYRSCGLLLIVVDILLFRVSSPCRTNARWRYQHILSRREFPCRLTSERFSITRSIQLIWQGKYFLEQSYIYFIPLYF